MEWALVGLMYVCIIGIVAMVVAFYLRCPHCGSWRGSREDPPAPVEPGLLAADDPRRLSV